MNILPALTVKAYETMIMEAATRFKKGANTLEDLIEFWFRLDFTLNLYSNGKQISINDDLGFYFQKIWQLANNRDVDNYKIYFLNTNVVIHKETVIFNNKSCRLELDHANFILFLRENENLLIKHIDILDNFKESYLSLGFRKFEEDQLSYIRKKYLGGIGTAIASVS